MPECITLWTEAEDLAERAAEAQAAADKATGEADAAQAAHRAAVLAATEAKQAHESVIREAAEVAAEITRLEKVGPAQVDERLQQETSHAAFLSFRRGDITADELREVFRRAEGYTPEYDRLKKRGTDLKAEEIARARARIEAERAEKSAAEGARNAVAAAAPAESAAREAQNAARIRRTAAEECERRHGSR
jgi:hypothetical protein